MRRECLLRHDTRYMNQEEKEETVQRLLAELDTEQAQLKVVAEEAEEVERPEKEDFVVRSE